MASRGRGGGLGVVYRQKKKSSGGGAVSKKASSTTTKNKKSSTTFGSDVTQPKASSLDLKDDYDEQEEVLRQFDMNMAYGPCIGLTRLARWERANKLGLNPPEHIEGLLKEGKVGFECLWDGRV
ncbi:polymerase delta [Thalictrum thalictroides]|uniref:Polymerase delta n=1 Tax=Thalictrum thalictroides TaxID=46969 RepID=A0A7J6WNE2_THATH|nr:polymerase delta [Thalictrum thalictroides]